MVDTARTSTDLLTNLFQDGQAAGAITPNDVRDFIVSAIPATGANYITTPAATTISVSGTYYKENGTWTSQGSPVGFTISGNRLTYTGTPTANFLLLYRASFTVSAGTNQTITFRIAKNGTTDTSTAASNLVDSGDTKVVAGFSFISLATNDYLELFVTNETSTNSVTCSKAVALAMRMFT